MPYLVNGQLVSEELIREESVRIGRDPQWQTIADTDQRAQRLRAAAEQCAQERLLVEQAAATDPRPIEAAVLDEAVQRQFTQWGCRSRFDYGQLWQLTERNLRVQRIRQEMVAGAVKPTTAELEAFYTANQASLPHSYWDTCHATEAPIIGLNNSTNTPTEYEFYNYSPNPYEGSFAPNPQEVGNQYFNTNGGLSTEGQLYYESFFNNSPSNGINIQNELYYLSNNTSSGNNVQQVLKAIQVAFLNYINYLDCSQLLTGNNNAGVVTTCSTACPNCNTSSGSCPPTYNP